MCKLYKYKSMNIKKELTVAALLLCSVFSFAQGEKEEAKVVFNPHWFMQVQGGASHTIGEADFSDLISPAASLSVGYQFNPIFGLRAGVSGWESKGGWVTPQTVYKYNYFQGNVDAMFDLSTLFCKYNPKRVFNAYGFAGIGINRASGNDDAVALGNKGYELKYLWDDSKILPVGRLGLGTNLRLSDHVFFNIEVNANILSDKYNSKKAGNPDFQFNALAGFTFKFGKTSKRIEPTRYEPTPVVVEPVKEEPKPVVVKTEEPTKEVIAALRENIFFNINSSVIRTTEESKVKAVIEYLNKYPEAKVVVTGYADAATGTPKINQRMSQKRTDRVVETLKSQGIAADRIKPDYKGDTMQPFEKVAENRVVICVAE